MKQVYKITYPTGKIYVGKDSVGSYRYMGSPDWTVVNADFATLPPELRRNYTVRKEILWESEAATEAELSAKEIEMIRHYRSNDPEVGYNRWPPLSPDNRRLAELSAALDSGHEAVLQIGTLGDV